MTEMPPLVMIEWTDASQPQPGWQRLTEIDRPSATRCVSVGFLVREDQHAKVIAPNLSRGGAASDAAWDQASGLLTIPHAAITNLRTISSFHLNLAAASTPPAPRPLADAPWLRRLA